MFYGTDIILQNIPYIRSEHGEYSTYICQSVPHNIVMDLKKVMLVRGRDVIYSRCPLHLLRPITPSALA